MRQVLLYQDEDGVWIAEVPSLAGCRSDGDTVEDALTNIREAIDLWIQVARERGEPVPAENHSARIAVLPDTAA